MDLEEWRPVVGYEGVYEVSSFGRVRRGGRILKGWVSDGGYLLVEMCVRPRKRRSVRVHRLVCEAFHGPSPEGQPHVLHGDGHPLNNKATNLRWGNPKENADDAALHGTRGKKAVCIRGHDRPPEGGQCKECVPILYRERRTKGIPPGDPRHGTMNGFNNFGCKCEDCRVAYEVEKRREQS